MTGSRETAGEIEYYARAMKAPRIRESAARLAEQARDGGWTHEEYLAAVLSREVAAREASGAETRARAARAGPPCSRTSTSGVSRRLSSHAGGRSSPPREATTTKASPTRTGDVSSTRCGRPLRRQTV